MKFRPNKTDALWLNKNKELLEYWALDMNRLPVMEGCLLCCAVFFGEYNRKREGGE